MTFFIGFLLLAGGLYLAYLLISLLFALLGELLSIFFD